jgi:hypothetical protein
MLHTKKRQYITFLTHLHCLFLYTLRIKQVKEHLQNTLSRKKGGVQNYMHRTLILTENMMYTFKACV